MYKHTVPLINTNSMSAVGFIVSALEQSLKGKVLSLDKISNAHAAGEELYLVSLRLNGKSAQTIPPGLFAVIHNIDFNTGVISATVSPKSFLSNGAGKQ